MNQTPPIGYERFLWHGWGAHFDDAVQLKGGPGSGNFGHAGRPGQEGGSGPGGEAGNLLALILQTGGFTYNPIKHRSPTSGFVVARPREDGMEHPYPLSTFKDAARARQIVSNFVKLTRDGIKSGRFKSNSHVGAWVDPPTNRVVLDVVEVYRSEDRGINVGKERKQDAIYDIAKRRVIDLRGKGQGYDGGADRRRDGRGVRSDSGRDPQGTGPVTTTERFPQKFNPNHAPAGSPEGGQFSSETGVSKGADGVYKDAEGKPANAADQKRLESLKLPPAWTDIRLNPDPKGALQAYGRDSKGRGQYRYSAEHSEEKAAEKFARLKDFNDEIKGIRARIAEDVQSEDPAIKDPASVLMLIDRTGFRVGSDNETGADVKAYGASTLRASHVSVNGSKVVFNFIGKKGVAVSKEVTDTKLAQMLRPRIKESGGGRLFETTDGAVRDYLHSRDGAFKPKDFRTWHGTMTAIREIKNRPIPRTESEFKRAQREVVVKVAAHLGNTPAVARKSYIDPSVWARWQRKFK